MSYRSEEWVRAGKNSEGDALTAGMEYRDEDLVPTPTPVFSFAFMKRSVSIRTLAGRIWENRVIFLAVVFLFLLVGIYQAHELGPRFVASIDIQPVELNVTGGTSSANGAVTGLLGTLNGEEAGGAEIPEFVQFQAALSSEGVAKILDERYDLLCRTFKGQCDLRTHRWKQLTGARAWVSAATAWVQGLPNPNGARTPADLAAYILGSVVSVKQKTGIVTLSYESGDPKFAAAFIWELWNGTNDYLKEKNRQVRGDYLAYLNQRINMTTSIAQREAIQDLILEEERHLMQSAANVPYAAALLDGPTVLPVNKVARIIAIYIFLGTVLGVAASLLVPRHFWARKVGPRGQ